MRWGAMGIVTLIVMLMTLYEWPKMSGKQKKEKSAFVALTAIGCILAALLIYFPNIPGPTQWIEHILKPFAKFFEK